jgi:hypothetical protein
MGALHYRTPIARWRLAVGVAAFVCMAVGFIFLYTSPRPSVAQVAIFYCVLLLIFIDERHLNLYRRRD